MGTLNEDLSAIKEVEDKIIANKVARFAYTDEAYEKNLANGVIKYNVNNAQNIPTADPSVLKVNNTVLSQGYRAQASSITRMLMNHFLGRLSYNVNKVNDGFSNLVATLIKHRGTANGFATLDENGRIPYSQLPESAAGDVKTVNNISPENGNIPLTGENIPVSSTDPTLLSAPLTTDRYANSSVTTEKIADNAVTNAKIKDPISVAKGGTGATNAKGAQYQLLNDVNEITSAIADDSTFIGVYQSPSVSTGAVYKRRASTVWNYIQSKISSVLGLTDTQYNGNAKTATNAEQATIARTADKTVNDITIGVPFVEESGQYVIPLGNIPEPTSTEVESPYIWDITGFLSFIRASGHNGSNLCFEAGHGYSHAWTTYAYLDALDFQNCSTSIKAFQYNGSWWIGLNISAKQQDYECKMTITYSKGLPATPTCILYNSKSNGIANEEIYNSIQDIPSSWWKARTIHNPTTFTQKITAPVIEATTNFTGNLTGNATNAINAYRGTTLYCSTARETVAKTVYVTGFTLATGACIRVLFTNGNNIANPTLNVNNTGAKEIRVKQGSEYVTLSAENGALRQGSYGWQKNTLLELYYNGSYWVANENAIVHEKLNSELGYLSSRVFINGRKEIWGGTSPYDITANESKVMTISSDLPINDDISNHSLSVITEIESTYVNAYGDIKLMDNTLKFSIYSRNLTNNSYRVKTVHIFVTGY